MNVTAPRPPADDAPGLGRWLRWRRAGGGANRQQGQPNVPEGPRRRRRIWAVMGLIIVLGLVLGFAWGEQRGWPWLVRPVAQVVAHVIERPVEVGGGSDARLHLWGGVHLSAPQVRIGAPDWAVRDGTPWLLSLDDGELAAGYGALWRMARGGKVELERLQARRVDAWLIRLPDGRASWQMGPPKPDEAQAVQQNAEPPWRSLTVHQMAMRQGLFIVDDQVFGLQARVSASVVPVGGVSGAQEASESNELKGLHRRAHGQPQWQWAALAEGSHRGLPLHVRARSTQPWNWASHGELTVEGLVGRARIGYQGPAPEADGAVAGRFSLAGPSLAAIGEALGVTLPTTAPFRMSGAVRRQGERTEVTVDQARIGDSRLSGDFVHDRATTPPTLTGVLRGSRLALADLGPAVGVPLQDGEPRAASAERVLPDRPFNLPSLRAMDADVRIAIDLFDTGNEALQDMRDLRGRILLQGGVLRLEQLSTRLAKGSVQGRIELDARQPTQALLATDLNVDDVHLEQWAKVLQRPGREPLASGVLSGRVVVNGHGRSTAELLGTLGGRFDLALRQGRVSHLGVELAGLDLMEGAVQFIKGDESLPITCAQVRLEARNGVLHPAPLIVSTPDSTLWADGQISLKDETLDLRTRVAPKDFTLVALRTPVQLSGPWRNVDVKVMHPETWMRILGAAALAAVNPLAGVLPLVDPGQRDEARAADQRCRQAMANKPS